jgi:SAM-dependent methyltransferase
LNIEPKELHCDSCESPISLIYVPKETPRGASVFICESCSLLQTKYSGSTWSKHAPSISSGAGWGNIRHGKGLRTNVNEQLIRNYLPKSGAGRILDIGSNRGDFALKLITQNQYFQVDLIEPDETIAGSYRQDPRFNLVFGRVETQKLEESSYDFIYCLHTLEHVDSAKETLQKIHASLRDEGYALIEVPSLEMVSDPTIVEEFFIDKHTFHFSFTTLSDLFERAGLRIVDGLDPDGRNLNFIVQKCPPVDTIPRTNVVAETKELVLAYEKQLSTNQDRLRLISKQISELSSRISVAIWGTSRILDALVVHGGLKLDNLHLVDDYLFNKISEVHGSKVHDSKSLVSVNPQLLIVLAKGSVEEIRKQARSLGVERIMTFDELFVDSFL